MKKEIHPDKYRLVAFKDMSNEVTFITKSTAPAKENIKIDGVEYPLIKLEISNTSHPFYTGKMKLVDSAGRVDKFMTKYKKHIDKKSKPGAKSEAKVEAKVEAQSEPETNADANAEPETDQ